MSVPDGGKRKTLWRLCRIQTCTRDRFSDVSARIDALQSIGDCHCGQHRHFALLESQGNAFQKRVVDEWPCGIVDHHMAHLIFSERPEAGKHRLLACRPAECRADTLGVG